MTTNVYICPHCNKEVVMPEDFIGTDVICPFCDNTFHINSSSPFEKEEKKDVENKKIENKWNPFNNLLINKSEDEDENEWNSYYKKLTPDEKLRNLEECSLGLASLCFILNPLFGFCAIMYSIQALAFVRIKDYDRAKKLKSTCSTLSLLGIILGCIFWFVISTHY